MELDLHSSVLPFLQLVLGYNFVKMRLNQMERDNIFITHAFRTRFHFPVFHFVVIENNVGTKGTKRPINNQCLKLCFFTCKSKIQLQTGIHEQS